MTEEWKNISERGNFWGIKFTAKLYRYGGRILVIPIVYIAVFYFFISKASTRRHSKNYLDRVSNFCTAEQKKTLSPWQHYLSFASSLLDRVSIWMNNNDFKHVDIPHQNTFLKACRDAPGAVVFTAHAGNFEMCRALTNDGSGIKANIVMDTGHSESFNKLISQIDTGAPVELIAPHELTPAMAVSLKQKLNHGECLFIMGDRVPPSNTKRVINTPILGTDARLPEGPFRLALALDCPVFFMTCVKTHADRFTLIIEQLDTAPNLSSKKDRIRCLGQSFAASLESLCKNYPLQWFNFYDYWQDEVPPHTSSSKNNIQR